MTDKTPCPSCRSTGMLRDTNAVAWKQCPHCNGAGWLKGQRNTPSADATRALLIEIRKYILRHGLLIGECVAWNKLKDLYGVGADQDADEAWLREYQQAGKGGQS